jgi:hypothetical protein
MLKKRNGVENYLYLIISLQNRREEGRMEGRRRGEGETVEGKKDNK